jgi:hypothetical protein
MHRSLTICNFLPLAFAFNRALGEWGVATGNPKSIVRIWETLLVIYGANGEIIRIRYIMEHNQLRTSRDGCAARLRQTEDGAHATKAEIVVQDFDGRDPEETPDDQVEAISAA